MTSTSSHTPAPLNSSQPIGARSTDEAAEGGRIIQHPSQTAKQGKKIKRPMNAFMLWAKSQRPILSKANPNSSNRFISQLLGIAWRELSEVQKRPFYEEARRLEQEHSQKFPDYVYQPCQRKRKRPSPTPEASQPSFISPVIYSGRFLGFASPYVSAPPPLYFAPPVYWPGQPVFQNSTPQNVDTSGTAPTDHRTARPDSELADLLGWLNNSFLNSAPQNVSKTSGTAPTDHSTAEPDFELADLLEGEINSLENSTPQNVDTSGTAPTDHSTAEPDIELADLLEGEIDSFLNSILQNTSGTAPTDHTTAESCFELADLLEEEINSFLNSIPQTTNNTSGAAPTDPSTAESYFELEDLLYSELIKEYEREEEEQYKVKRRRMF